MELANNVDGNRRSETSELSCCRACLATEGKLFNMHEHELVGEFFRITGVIVTETDKLPQHLCVWCAGLIKRCSAFRAKCHRASQCLQLLGGKLTTDSVRKVDRLANRLVHHNLTDTEVVNIESSVIPVELLPMPVTNLPTEETGAVKEELCTAIGLNENDNVKYESDYTYDAEDICEDIFENISHKALKTEAASVSNVKKNADSKRKRQTKPKTEVKKRQRKKKTDSTADSGKGKSEKCEKRIAGNDYMPNVNMEEFKEKFDVDIVILTHEEQVAEIEARRNTDKYKEAVYRCQPCGKYFRTEEVLQHHSAKHALETGPYECPVCGVRHRCRPTQLRHTDTHRVKFVCRPCGFVSRTRTQAKLHHAFHAGKKYPCKYCGKEFSKRTTWLGHVRSQHKAMNVACDLCGETFVNQFGLKCHKVLMHGVAKQKEFKTMECKICEVTFVSPDALKTHKMAGEHDKMAACAQCGASFDTEGALKVHVEAEHPRCQECNATFLNAGSYEVHITRKHLGKGDGAYSRRREANRRARARGQPLPYPPPPPPLRAAPRSKASDAYKVCCELCGKIVSVYQLEFHLQRHRGEKMPFACHICPKSFYIKQQLEHHMRVHTGEKPFCCEQCDVAFTLKSNLTRHMRVVHEGIRRTTECPICGRHLATPFTMKMHVRTVHNGEPWPKRAPRDKKKQKGLE